MSRQTALIREETTMPSPPPGSRLHGLSPLAVQHVVAAAEALDAGRVDVASQRLQAALTSHPGHPEVLRMQAGIFGLHGQHQDAIQAMRRALSQRPQDALYHNTLGTLLGNAGNLDAAIAALRHCCELQPGLAIAWYNLGVMLIRCVRHDEAVIALHRAVELAPDHASARALLGNMLRTTGQVEEAATEYRRVIVDQPWAGMAWWGLAELKTVGFVEGDIERMQAAMQQSAAGVEDLIAMGFALAKAFDDAGRYAESLAALAQANALARQRQQWNAPAFSATVSAINQAFVPPSAPAPETLGKEAIFIVSLPRSGSTLTEQILASHSAVEGAGELSDLPQVLSEEARRRRAPFPSWVPQMQPADWKRLGERYLERTAHWQRHRARFTDKLPNNWMYIGAIRAMLPAARIVVCRRDPLETCFSCYRQHLANSEYTRTFEDLAAFWRDFDVSIRHWKGLHPTHVFEHSHEQLQAAPEERIRRLLDFCGLPFEPACLNFHKTRRDVRSPSAAQVRQPLRKDTSHALRYGALLDPLRSALGLPPWQA
jgi:tetratricopeptide (TPR) repeat protein